MANAVSTAATKLWQKAVGNPEAFSLESRIFHSFSLIAFTILGFETIFNLCFHLTPALFITGSVLLIQLYLFYLSRVKGHLKLAVLFSIIEINILTAFDYIYESGVTGPSLLLYVTALFMIICTSGKRYWKICLIANLAIVAALLSWEYFHPDSIVPYNSRLDIFLNNGLAYAILAILLYVGTSLILNSYNQQKQLTEEKAQAFKQLNTEKDKLLSIISHDLRGPLSSIQQYFTMLSGSDLSAAERQPLESHLLKTISNTQELVTNILSWTKNQMSGIKIHLHPLVLAQELEKTIELFRLIARRKNIQLTADINQNIMVTADTDMLQLVIRNLLNNAIKFSNTGATVTVKASADNGICTVTVKDNGIGIPADKQQDIFTLNVKSTYGTSDEKGSGLGLALCREFMQLQKGDISFTSTAGEGSEFYITLPCEACKD